MLVISDLGFDIVPVPGQCLSFTFVKLSLFASADMLCFTLATHCRDDV